MRKSTGKQTEEKKKESIYRGPTVLVRFLKQLSKLNAGEELREKSVSDVCKTLADLQQIAEVCEKKHISVVFEDDDFTIDDGQNMSLAESLETIIRMRKIIVSAQTKAGLDKARKAGKRLGTIPGSSWKIKKLTGREKEIQTFLDNKITLSAIARALKVDTKTLKTFMKDNGLSRNKEKIPLCGGVSAELTGWSDRLEKTNSVPCDKTTSEHSAPLLHRRRINGETNNSTGADNA